MGLFVFICESMVTKLYWLQAFSLSLFPGFSYQYLSFTVRITYSLYLIHDLQPLIFPFYFGFTTLGCHVSNRRDAT